MYESKEYTEQTDNLNIEIKNKNNIPDIDIKLFFEYFNDISKLNNLLHMELLNNTKSLTIALKYTRALISIYLNGYNIGNDNKRINLSKYIKNYIYFKKIINELKTNMIIKVDNNKIIFLFLIAFFYNVFTFFLSAQNKKKYNKININMKLNNLLKISFNIILKLYLDSIINDNNLELILLLLLIFSFTNKIDKIPKEKEITNMMFFNASISLMKIIFNKIIFINHLFTQKQEEIINNILLFINNNFIETFEESEENKININYINKVFLYKNDYKTSSLIDLSFIISKIKSKDIKNNFINLLTNIYILSFDYHNLMVPIIKQLEPLFININKKNINQIDEELGSLDIPLSLLDSLIKKEIEIYQRNACFLKEGFYFGNEKSGIIYDFSIKDDEFFIMLGFKLEQNESPNITLFQLVDKQTKSTQIKIFFSAKSNKNIYEMIIGDKKHNEISTKININLNKNYIFLFHIKKGGFIQQKNSQINIHYIEEENQNINKKEYNPTVYSSKEIKIKSIKIDNLRLYLGCNEDLINEDKIKNNFKGFMGDLIIFNKNLKMNNTNNNNEIERQLLYLGGHYSNIFYISLENQKSPYFYNSNYIEEFYNSNFNYLKQKFNEINENKSKISDSIKDIISSKYFNVIEYNDNINYMSINNNLDEHKNSNFKIKRQYLITKDKLDIFENNKVLKLDISNFDKNFHIFENKFTLLEFIKYDGFYYLILLLEYYYQILNNLYIFKSKYQTNDINNICQRINTNINNVLKFFDNQIITNKIYSEFLKQINRFLCQMSITLLKFLEFTILSPDTINFLVKMLNLVNFSIYKFSKNSINDNKYYFLIRDNLFDFLLNQKLYDKNDINCLEKLNYVMENLLNIIKIIKNKSSMKNDIISSLLNIDILNKLLSFVWLFDNYNNNNTNISDSDNKDKNYINYLYELIGNNYFLLLIEFLKNYYFYNSQYIKSASEKSLIQVKNKNAERNFNSSKTLKLNTNNTNNEISLIDYFFEKTLEKTWNSYIFSKMTLILLNTNLINQIEEQKIEKLKYIFVRILINKEEKYYDNKKLLFLSFLQILIIYYYTEDDIESSYQNQKINKKEELHLFIRNLDLNLDLFYSLISSFKIIKYLSNNYLYNDNVKSSLEIIDMDDLNNTKNKDKITNDIINSKNLLTICALPFEEIDLNNLNAIQTSIIKNLLEDLIYLLSKLENNYQLKKCEIDLKNMKYNDSSESTLSLENRDIGNEIFDIIKKNINIIFSFKNTAIFNEIFSYNTKICSELYYLIWKYNKSENESKNIEELIIEYHKDLLQIHSSPFIYKFFLMLSKSIISSDNYKENYIENQTKISLFTFIIDTLFEIKKQLKTNKNSDKMIYIFNLINVIIMLNKELEFNLKNFFTINQFRETLYKYLYLLKKSLLIYSNYYIELEENNGKLICEIIFDIFFEISQYYSNEDDFYKYFTKCDIEENEITIFYLIDLFKENNLVKDINLQNDMGKYYSKSQLNKLKYLYKNFFNQNTKIKDLSLIKNTKLFPIEGFNFTIYFLSKILLYLEAKIPSKELIKILEEKFIPLLINNINKLIKEKKSYEDKASKTFPLYTKTKALFEANHNLINYEILKNLYKENVLSSNEVYNIKLHLVSRLIHDYLDKIKTPKTKNKLKFSSVLKRKKNDNTFPTPKDSFRNYSISNPNPPKLLDLNINTRKNSYISLDEINHTKLSSSDDFSLLSITEKEEINFCCKFEGIKKGNIIYNPKTFFLKIIFSNVFKNILFNDKIFKSIRLCYLIKYRKYNNINKELKQINYPSKQKNFANSLEPQMFLRRDYNFYDKIFFPITHRFINLNILKEKEEQIYFYPHEYKIKDIKNLNDKIVYCDLVTKKYIYFGKMHFTFDFILFESEKDDPRSTPDEIDLEGFFKYAISTTFSYNKKEKPKKKYILIFSTEIKEIIQRRTLLVNQSIEIFNKNGKSFFFNFFTTKQVEQVYKYFKIINNYLTKQFSFNTDNNKDDIKFILESFHKGRMTNYEYILYLNKYSTRTYNDLSQYPIFPWLLFDHSKINDIFYNLLNNKNINNDLRDMRYPISAQTAEKREIAILKFIDSREAFPSHFGTHYSNAAYIFYYLMRLNPYTQGLIELQSYKLEDPYRTFNSLEELEDIINGGFDNRELIPDIFCYIDYFINLNCSFYGIKNGNTVVNDFIMQNFTPNKYVNTISSYIDLLYNLKRLLNYRYISEKLNDCVDIIFGKSQLPKKEEKYKESCNKFEKQSYEQKLNLEKKIERYKQKYKLNKNNKVQIYNKIKYKIEMVTLLGMTPKQILFDSNLYAGGNKTPENIFKQYISGKDKFLYFTRIYNDNFLFLKKDINNKTKTKNITIFETNKSQGKHIYDCKDIKLFNCYFTNRNK